MPSLRRRREYEAAVLTLMGNVLTEGYVIAEVTTTVNGAQREVTWAGKITSLTQPQVSLHGPYLLRPRGAAEPAAIRIVQGATDRRGLSSDEYLFKGEGSPPTLP